LKIPHVYDGGTKTFYFVSYFGFITSNPFDTFATVPTLAERTGDFSQTRTRSGPNAGQIVQIINPQTGLPFARTPIPRLNPAGASNDPFDYGIPTLSFTNFTGLRDNSPLTRRDLTWSLSENASLNRGKHNWRFGGDFRRIHQDLRSSTNPRGSFTFTGFSTAA